MKLKYPLVAVRWNDAHGSATDACEPEAINHAPMLMITYGLLLRQDAAGVTVACEDCGDGTYRGRTFVPAGMLVSVDQLLPAKKQSKKKTHQPVLKAADGVVSTIHEDNP